MISSPKPTGRPGHSKVNHVAYAIMIKAFFGRGATCAELEAVCGLSVRSLWSVIRVFRKHKIIYVSDWETDRWGRFNTARYALGNLPDKPKPPPRTGRKSD